MPIVPDESRTFGMEGMFRQLGIWSSVGQLYTPEDADQLMFYKEDKNGQILQEGINATVIDMHTIKPIDTKLLDELSKKVQGIVTVEDHSIIGGLGSAVSEYLSENKPTRVVKIGVDDRFGESGGSEELLELVGLTIESIESAVRSIVKL